MGSNRMRLALALALTLTTGYGSADPGGEPLVPETARSAMLDLAADPMMNGYRPEHFPGESGEWHSDFLDEIQSPASLDAICAPIGKSRSEG